MATFILLSLANKKATTEEQIKQCKKSLRDGFYLYVLLKVMVKKQNQIQQNYKKVFLGNNWTKKSNVSQYFR